MAQEVKIGVSANAGAAASGIQKIDEAAAGVADSFDDAKDSATGLGKAIDGVGLGTDRAADEAERYADALERARRAAESLKQTQSILSRDLGIPISEADARAFSQNFERMRTGRGLGSQRLKAFDSFENWYLGHRTSFRRTEDADRHRRYVMSVGMQGTSYARENGAPPPMPPGGPTLPPAPGGGRGAGFETGVKRAHSMAMSFGKSMLALAGINSVMGMAGASVDMATEESVGIDTLKRRAGDLGQSFDKLQDDVRGATQGLGMAYVESARLSQQFAKTAGDLRGINVGGELRSAIGLSRAYGLDPAAGTQFFGTMQRLRVTGGSDQENRRLALMIGDAISNSGYSARGDEMLAAITNFATQIARVTLGAPNVDAYASYLTGLSRTGLPGLDPSGAAALLDSADASVRRGGGMGAAGLNFTYAAMSRYSPHMSVVSAEALMAGGLFGTTQGTFGRGTALGRWYGSHHMATPGLNGTTNLVKIRSLMRRMYGGSPYYLDAMKNYFGLSSIEQAAAIDMMKPADIGASSHLLSTAGVDISKISASGIQGIARIAGAHTMGQLSPIASDVFNRADISDSERSSISNAIRTGSVEKLREALVKVVSSHEQEQTEGSQTRQSVADLKNELTRVGTALLVPLNLIRDAVVAVANHVAPDEYKKVAQLKEDMSTDYIGAYGQKYGAGAGADLAAELNRQTENFNRMRASGAQMPTLDQMEPRPDPGVASADKKGYAWMMARRQNAARLLGMPSIAGRVPSDWQEYMSGTDAKLGLPSGMSARQIMKESSFDPNNDNRKSGAMGLAQVMPKTLQLLQKRLGYPLDPHDPKDALRIQRLVLGDSLRSEHGNLAQALLDYGGFISPGKRHGADAMDYLTKILGPDWKAYDHNNSAGHSVNVGVTGEVHLPVKDSGGNHVGTAILKPFLNGPPAGVPHGFVSGGLLGR